MRPVTDWCRHKALFFDTTGRYVGDQKISWKDTTFGFKKGMYNFLPHKATFFKIRRIFSTTKYYLYKIGDPNPIKLEGYNQPIIEPKTYRRVLETNLIKKLEEANQSGLIAFLSQPKVIIIIIVAILIFMYMSSGGTPEQAVNYVSGRN